MILGLLSDSHDNAVSLRAAIDLLVARGAKTLLHMGDMCAPEMLDLFAGLPEAGIPVHFVFGNNDFDRVGLRVAAAKWNLMCHGYGGTITIDGVRLALTHGDNPPLAGQLLGAKPAYLFTGHTHRPDDSRRGRTRLINPGALHRANPRTAALLDLSTKELTVVPVAVAGLTR